MNDRSRFDAITTWDHVQALKGESESVHLECKRKKEPTVTALDADDRDNLAMPASAFANGGGGTLIFGATTKQGDTALQSREITGFVTISNVKEFADRLEAYLSRAVDPSLAGCDVRPIDSGDRSGVVLVFVPESHGGPHRVIGCSSAVNERYYMRTSTSTVIMPHSALADRFARNAQPRMQLVASYDINRRTEAFAIELRVRNEGRGAARKPAFMLVDPSPEFDFMNGAQQARVLTSGWRVTRSVDHKHVTRLLFEATDDVVIYPGTDRLVINCGNRSSKALSSYGSEHFRFRGSLYALDVQPRAFEGALKTGAYAVDRIEVPQDHEKEDKHESV